MCNHVCVYIYIYICIQGEREREIERERARERDKASTATLDDTSRMRALLVVLRAFSVLLLGALLLLMVVAPTVKLLRPSGAWRQLRWRTRTRKMLRSMSWTRLSPEEARLEELASQRLASYWNRGFKGVRLFCVTFLLVSVRNASEQQACSLLERQLALTEKVWLLGTFAYLLASAMLFVERPSWLIPRNMYIWLFVTYVGNIAALVTITASTTSEGFALLNNHIRFCDLLHVALACCSWKKSYCFLLNVVWSAFVWYYLGLASPTARQDTTHWALRFHIGTCILKLFANLLCRHIIQKELLGTAAMTASFQKLLLSMCDAVVHLDGDLTFRRPCRQLNALLLNTSGAKDPQNLLDFMSADDGARFRASVQELEATSSILDSSQSSSLADTMHVEMFGAYQTRVGVQLYYVSYVDATGKLCVMAGAKECRDDEHWKDKDMPLDTQSHLANIPEHLVGARGRARAVARTTQPTGPQSERSHDTTLQSERSDAELAPVQLAAEDAPGEVAVWVDASDSAMPVIKCTQSFLAQIGGRLKRSTSLLSWIRRKDQSCFYAAIRSCITHLL